jgi:hypothetical protein
MVRLSKQTRKRHKSHRRPSMPAKKTGPLKETNPMGYVNHANALAGEAATQAFIAKIK